MSQQRHLEEFFPNRKQPPRTPDANLLKNSQFHDEVMRVYRELGGCLPQFPVRVGKYDISTDNFDIELDEKQHFNRYRGITLNSGIYDYLPGFPMQLYSGLCVPVGTAENHCPSYGGWWSNISADRQYGTASASDDFSGNGSSRWKQRAFYDYIKDVLPLLVKRTLVRISVYDKVKTARGEFTVGQILRSPDYLEYTENVRDFIESRLLDSGRS